MNIVDKHRQGFSSTVSAYDELSDTAKTLVHTASNREKHLCQLYVLKVDRTLRASRCSKDLFSTNSQITTARDEPTVEVLITG